MAEVGIRIVLSGAPEAAAGFEQAAAAARKFGSDVQQASEHVQRASEQSRQAYERAQHAADRAGRSVRNLTTEQRAFLASVRDLSQTLQGTAAILSIFARGNQDLQDKLEKLTVNLTLVSAGLSLYRNAAQLAAGTTVLLTNAVRLLSGPVGIAVAALGALVAVGGAVVAVMRQKAEAAHRAAEAQAAYAAMASRSAAASEQLRHAQREGQLSAADFARGQLLAAQALQRLADEEARAAQRRQEALQREREALQRAAAERERAFAAHIASLVAAGKAYEGVASEAERAFLRSPAWVEYQQLLARITEGNRQASEATRAYGLTIRSAAQSTDDVSMKTQLWNDMIQSIARELDDLVAQMDEMERKQREFADSVRRTVSDTLVGILTGTATFADLWAAIWRKAVEQIIEQIGLVRLAMQAVSFIFGLLGIHLQTGGQLIATRPTRIMVGERGPERVTVQPLAGGPARIIVATRPTPLVVGQARPERVIVQPVLATAARPLVAVVSEPGPLTAGAATQLQRVALPVLAAARMDTWVAAPLGGPTLPGARVVATAAAPQPIAVAAPVAALPTVERERWWADLISALTQPADAGGGGGGGGGRVVAFQSGGEILATRPTGLVVGERGPERVTVQPLAAAGDRRPAGGPVINVFGPLLADEITWARFERRYGLIRR
ncbi:MAG: hypothetical protein QN183_13780 [Armatimonadota bacterium]|nr:hypothetical protein [Armatimonadota bacterium]